MDMKSELSPGCLNRREDCEMGLQDGHLSKRARSLRGRGRAAPELRNWERRARETFMARMVPWMQSYSFEGSIV